jgi:hypothetical protein
MVVASLILWVSYSVGAPDLVAHLGPGDGVEAAERLVHQEYLRLGDHEQIK